MALGKQQTCCESLECIVDCLLMNVIRQLEADMCKLECLEVG